MKISSSFVAINLWLAAFLVSFTWYTPFENEFFMGMMTFLLTSLAVNDMSGIDKREWKYPVSPVLVAGGLFWLCAAVSMFASQILFVSWIYFFFLSVLPFTIIFFLVGDNFEKRMEDAWRGVKFILAGLSLYAIGQFFFLPELLYQGRVQEPLADPNSLAAVFSLGIFLIGGMVLKQGRAVKPIDLALLFLYVAGFFTTGSRGAFLAMAVAGILFIFSIGLRRISRYSWIAMGAIAVTALVLIGVVYTPTYYSGPLKVLQYSSGLSLQTVLAERGMIWATALSMVKSNPWFGTGPGTFPLYYGEVKNILDTTAGFTVHNEPLQFAVEYGMPAAILFYIVCVLAAIRTVKTLRALSGNDVTRFDILTPFFALVAMVFHAHLTANFHVLPCLMLAGFSFSLWYYRTGKILNENLRVITAPKFFDHKSLLFLFGMMASVMIILITAPLYSQRLAKNAVTHLEAGNMQAFADAVDQADFLSSGTNANALLLAAGIPLEILEQPESSVTEKDRSDFISQISRLLKRAEHNNPRNADMYWMKGRLAKLENKSSDKEKYLQDAIRINPAHMSARMALADYYEAKGQLGKAVDIMSSGIDVRYSLKDAQRYFEYYMRTEHMKERLKKEKKAPE